MYQPLAQKRTSGALAGGGVDGVKAGGVPMVPPVMSQSVSGVETHRLGVVAAEAQVQRADQRERGALSPRGRGIFLVRPWVAKASPRGVDNEDEALTPRNAR